MIFQSQSCVIDKYDTDDMTLGDCSCVIDSSRLSVRNRIFKI